MHSLLDPGKERFVDGEYADREPARTKRAACLPPPEYRRNSPRGSCSFAITARHRRARSGGSATSIVMSSVAPTAQERHDIELRGAADPLGCVKNGWRHPASAFGDA